ncbi:MAG: FKBP-type peptidyl-prolyl cis-trans isomerase N-terminal domain-containing protein [Sphaerochaetaceae bacterium]|nr:FKBP-type peptidyl-prolyl cis-trans isomerase N-terminal domain-containing protein [Spirochaetales bacterium]MDY5499837.1 FKBP-type peptidyl-prolyl cis-trans isomerase N-terminal domain-containing protein [Sphaerochaetaceae bacterium]
MQRVGLLALASVTLCGGLFAAGAKEKQADCKAARVLEVMDASSESPVYNIRLEDGTTTTMFVDADTKTNWPVGGLASGDYLEVVLDDTGYATYLKNVNIEQALELTSYNISKSVVMKPSDLVGRFSYTYGYLLLKTLSSQGLYFNVDYFVRGSLDAIQVAANKPITEFFTSEEMNAELEYYQTNVWSQGQAPITFTGNNLGEIESIDDLEKPTDDVSKFSYVYGYLVTYNMVSQGLNVNGPYFAYGMMDAGRGDTPIMAEAEMQDAFQTYQAQLSEELRQKNVAEAEAFFASNKDMEGVVTTPSGLQYQILVESDGAHPVAEDEVKFHYQLKDLAGNVLQDSKTMGDEAPTMAINNLVEGLVEGIPLMTVGSTWRFWLPAELAYGEFGAGDIEPDQAIQFDIQLLDIVKAEEPATTN